MRLFEKYIATKIFINFVYLLVAILFVIWLTRSNEILQLIINNGIGLSNFFIFSLLAFPEILFYIIPVALFMSTITIFIKLRQTSEIFALKNAGLANVDLARPVFIVAILATILHLTISLYLGPASKRTISRKIDHFNEKIGSFLIEERVFIHPTKNITIYADKRNKHGVLFNIFVNDQRDQNKNIVMFAERGQFVIKNDKSYLDLHNGKRQMLTESGLGVINFDYFSVNIDIKNSNPKPRQKTINEMGVFQLISTHEKGDSNLIEIYNRLSMPMLNIILASISVLMILEYYRSAKSYLWVITTYTINFIIFILFTFLTRLSLDNHIFAYASCIALLLLITTIIKNFAKN